MTHPFDLSGRVAVVTGSSRGIGRASVEALGALGARVVVNNVGGVQGRLILNFVNGAGFVGIAVAFMGRGHPVGVGLSALLFGVLYQGGQELAFQMPGITREMIVTLQALVILFTGAMGDMLRTPLAQLFARLRPAGDK